MPETRSNELFTPFNRLGLEALDIQGTGIGLSVSKKLVTMMNGHMGYQPNVPAGSIFWFELPLVISKPLASDVSEHANAAAPSTQLSTSVDAAILYVEDNPTNIKLLEAVCESVDGLTLTTVNTAEEGIQLAAKTVPDIIILDIHLPGMSGLDAIVHLRLSLIHI